MIENVPHCRFATIEQIRERVAADNFTYKSVRVAGRVLNPPKLDELRVLISDPNDETQTLSVDTQLFKRKYLEPGTVYEFLGEIEEDQHNREDTISQDDAFSRVYLRARVLKKAAGFHKMVYADTAKMVNELIEAIT